MGPRQNRCHSGPGQAVVQALVDSHSRAERRLLSLEQSPAAVGLHHRDGHALALAEAVELLPLGVRAGQHVRGLIGGLVEQHVNVLVGRHDVIGRVDAEHDNVDKPGLHRLDAYPGVMGAHANMPDLPGGFQLLGKLDHRAAHHRVKVLLPVHIVYHAHVYVVRPKPGEQVRKGAPDLVHVPGALILPVHPDGA